MEVKITLNVDGKEQEFKLFVENDQDITEILWEVRLALREELHK